MCENCDRMGISPSLGEQIAAMQQQAMMRMTDKKAAVVDFLTRQSREDLVTIIDMIEAAKGSKTTGGLFMGIAKGILIQKYETNFDGQTMEEALAAEEMVRHAEHHRDGTHEPEAGGMVADEEYMRKHFDIDPTPREDSNDPAWKFPPNTHDPETGAPLRSDGYPVEHLTDAEILEGMRKYNLQESETEGRYTCRGCGLEYMSISDRALRDDCHGCMARAAQG